MIRNSITYKCIAPSFCEKDTHKMHIKFDLIYNNTVHTIVNLNVLNNSQRNSGSNEKQTLTNNSLHTHYFAKEYNRSRLPTSSY